jgi:hypothetical protein
MTEENRDRTHRRPPYLGEREQTGYRAVL